MFICYGNICRSPMAEFVMKDLAAKAGLSRKFHIASSATSTDQIGNDMHHAAKGRLRAENIPFAPRHAVQFSKEDYARYDYIIGMDGRNVRTITAIAGGDPDNKIYKLMDFTDEAGEDVADPWYTGNFIRALDDIKKGCTALMEKVLEEDLRP